MRFRRIAPLNSLTAAAASNPAATVSAAGCSDEKSIRTSINIDHFVGEHPFETRLTSDDKGQWRIAFFQSHAM